MVQFLVKGDLKEIPDSFKKMRGHYIADYETLDLETRNELKKKFPQGYFRLAYWEEGGSNFEDGKATIVCSKDGEPLVPIKINKFGWLANEKHALFVGNTLCTIQANLIKRDITLKLELHNIKNKIGIIETEILWEGTREELENLPEDVVMFENALRTAVRKVLEYRCTIPMFYEKLN